ncbi:tRNA (adenine(58)-N(1))-methyltransferase catalytic subunit trm61 [Paramyrothecium foliicola]|nr:tRNA (adenine(58)-N(1))-methyltransferase catalytic subunit trm61 [Paramyrothecium foliicola]
MEDSSPFLNPKSRTSPGVLAIVLLSRDNYQPVELERSAGAVDGYLEGAVLNTRFGSFPHSTLLDVPWGSQVRASHVDTGSRGRRKRRREATDEDTPTASNTDVGGEEADAGETAVSAPAKKATAAASGFIHVLRPTPELWTSSLPHRTQVVYTPDYSYILHRIRARPGSRIIEAGAGSGSFTHASARAVFNGYPSSTADKKGKVFSFEFHEPRFVKMQEEIKSHGMENIVRISHRDVYQEGFIVDGASPNATAVFLDLPAPWEALHHLSRRNPKAQQDQQNGPDSWISPLDPKQTVYICTFSPCIEQVMRTMEELRKTGWIEVDMVEIAHKRVNVVRERVGLNLPSERGFNQSPADVGEAVKRLKQISKKSQELQKVQAQKSATGSEMEIDEPAVESEKPVSNDSESVEDEKPWMQGRVTHRTEQDLKTHTSYLVFAMLPPEWDDEAEAAAMAKWPCGQERKTIGNVDKNARKQEKREALQPKRRKRNHDTQA